MHTAITRPLAPGDRAARLWLDGRPAARVVGALVRPNAKLRPLERVEIYNRMYWFRLLDCAAEDHPGLRALLGERRFDRLARAYLAQYPSRSFSLRNLCRHLARFIAEEPRWTAPGTAAALDLARFEWAQIVAFDGPALPPLTAETLAGSDARRLRVQLQPYLSLLTLGHAVDDFVLAVKRDGALRAEASNAVAHHAAGSRQRVAPPLPGRIHLAVHRLENVLYYKRLDPLEIRLLRALAAGRTLAAACAAVFRRWRLPAESQAEKVRAWCAVWIQLGWICARE
jgi:hypothetical protein